MHLSLYLSLILSSIHPSIHQFIHPSIHTYTHTHTHTYLRYSISHLPVRHSHASSTHPGWSPWGHKGVPITQEHTCLIHFFISIIHKPIINSPIYSSSIHHPSFIHSFPKHLLFISHIYQCLCILQLYNHIQFMLPFHCLSTSLHPAIRSCDSFSILPAT